MFLKKFKVWVYTILFFQLLYIFEKIHDKKLEKNYLLKN